VPLFPLVVLPTLAGVAVAVLVGSWPSLDPGSPRAALAIGHEIERDLEAPTASPRRARLAAFVAARVDAKTATGALLGAAAVVLVVGGVVLGVLALLVRSHGAVVTVDRHVAEWANDERTPFVHGVLTALTDLGATAYVVPMAVVVATVEIVRRRSRWIVPFLATVLVGEVLLSDLIKDLVDRARPAFDPVAHTLGPSFPSGHSTTAAAFWAAVALLVGRGRSRRTRALLAGGAVALGVLVACTRVLLDVHWFSDVAGGLVLGWTWFAVCAIAFGGRLLRFGAPVELARRGAEVKDASVGVVSTEIARTAVGVEDPGVEQVEHRARRD